MSGGRFNYYQHYIEQITDEIEQIIDENDSTEKDDYDQDKGYHFSPETIEKFREAVVTLRRAYIMAQRIDWLVSSDDGEYAFHRRWAEDLKRRRK